MSKRLPEDAATDKSQKKVHFEPTSIGPISTLEEMDVQVLRFQNKKLAERFDQKKRCEADLRQQIEQLKKVKTQNENVSVIINRYWNQLLDDIKLLAEQFDTKQFADLDEKISECSYDSNFLMNLFALEKEELDEKLMKRFQDSQKLTVKFFHILDNLSLKCDKIFQLLHSDCNEDVKSQLVQSVLDEKKRLQEENKRLHILNTKLHDQYRTQKIEVTSLHEKVEAKDRDMLELRDKLDDVQYEFSKIQARNDKLETHLADAIEKLKAYRQNQSDGTRSGSTSGTASANNTSVPSGKLDEMNKELDELRDLATNRLQELDKMHNEHRDMKAELETLKLTININQIPKNVITDTPEYKNLQSQFSVLYNESIQLNDKYEDMRLQFNNFKTAHFNTVEVMEREELIAQRNLRKEILQQEGTIEKLRKDFEMLRIEFEHNLAANEQTGPINREMRNLITSLQNNAIQLKTDVNRYKRKYKEANNELANLRNKLKENTAKVEAMEKQMSTTKVSKSIQCDGNTYGSSDETDLSTSNDGLVSGANVIGEVPQSQNIFPNQQQIDDIAKSDVSPSTQDADDSADMKMENEMDNVPANGFRKEDVQTDVEPNSGTPVARITPMKKDQAVKTEKLTGNHPNTHSSANPSQYIHPHMQRSVRDPKLMESEHIRDLKSQLKKAYNDQKEMKLLLDMHKGVSKEHRDKAQLMASEKKIRGELEDLRNQMKKMQESKREERKKLVDEDALRKIKQLEDQKHELQKQLAHFKQPNDKTNRRFSGSMEEEALLNEMEVTGQAFEDMQEQNSRLLQQLREKDDANFKLMSESIKTNQLIKLTREEKDIVVEQNKILKSQIESINSVVRKLEEKEQYLLQVITALEGERLSRQKALESQKKKTVENTQAIFELKTHLEKTESQIKEAQQSVYEKSVLLESEFYKNRRLQEEVIHFRRKSERLKKMEMSGNIDEIMVEEIREYKEILTCPSCKVKPKDAVLTKCFHIFCWDCIKTRYETRQRKCPKCNCAFGANDYHRLYLSS